MTSVQEILGKPFVTSSGQKIPDYALPIIKSFYSQLPVTDATKLVSPVTPEVAEETIIAVERTLKRLSNGNWDRDLKLLPPDEYNVLIGRGVYSLPKLPSQFSIKGSTRHLEESEEYIDFAERVWFIVRDAFDIPWFGNSYDESEQEKETVEAKYTKSSDAAGLRNWILQLSISAGSLAGTIPLGFALDSVIPATVSGVIAGATFLPGPMLWMPYGERVYKKRLQKYYASFSTRQEQIKQELQSFILQAQTLSKVEIRSNKASRLR